MKDLGGNSFDINDFIHNEPSKPKRQDYTPGEQISSLLGNIDDFVIEEKKVEENRKEEEDMDMELGEIDNSQLDSYPVDAFDLSDALSTSNKRINQHKMYDVTIEDDDVYVPIAGEKNRATQIASMETVEPTFILGDEDIEKDQNFKVLNSNEVLTVSGDESDSNLNNVSDDGYSYVEADRSAKKKPYEQVVGMDSSQLLAELGLEASPVKIKSNHKSKPIQEQPTQISSKSQHQQSVEKPNLPVNRIKKPASDTATPNTSVVSRNSFNNKINKINEEEQKEQTNVRSREPLLKKQDPKNIIEDDVSSTRRIASISSNKDIFDSLVSQMSVNNPDESKETVVDLSAFSKAREIMDNLDDMELSVSGTNRDTSRATTQAIIQKLNSSIESTGKHYVEVDIEYMSAEVQSVLKNVYDLDIVYGSKGCIVKYKEIPNKYQEQRNIYLKGVLKRFRNILLKINHNYKTTKVKQLQVPLVFDCKEDGVMMVTPVELKMIISTIDKGYIYELQEDKILLWGVK